MCFPLINCDIFSTCYSVIYFKVVLLCFYAFLDLVLASKILSFVLLDNLDEQNKITAMVSVGMQVDLWSSSQIKPCLALSLIRLPF